MTLLEHLAELRSAVVSSVVVALLAASACWFFSARLLDLLVRPLAGTGNRAYFHSPFEAFVTRIKIAFVCGLFIVLPYVLYRLYAFVVPGLYRRERKIVTPLLIGSVVMFYLGVAFSFLILVPQVVRIMLSFGTPNVQPLIGIGPYFSFVAQLCLAFGLVFELPMVVVVLSLLGLIDPRLLLRTWRIAVVIISIASAALTPGPDAISFAFMFVPLTLLYLSSVILSVVLTRRRRRASRPEGD
jgi:sec-independent protein translocase protein TatC